MPWGVVNRVATGSVGRRRYIGRVAVRSFAGVSPVGSTLRLALRLAAASVRSVRRDYRYVTSILPFCTHSKARAVQSQHAMRIEILISPTLA